MNKKNYLVIIFVFVVIVIIILAGLFFYFKKSGSPVKKVSTEKSIFSIIDDKENLWDSKTVQSYKIDAAEFRVYPLISSTNNLTAGYFEVLNNGKKVFASDPDYSINELISFQYNANKYVVVDDYSGGAHCCNTDYLFRINSAGDVKLIKTFDMGNAGIIKDSLLLKGNQLYFVLGDDRFSYFHTPYAGSYFFYQYYKLDGDNVIIANNDFKDSLIKTANDCQSALDQEMKDIATDSSGRTFSYWFNSLLCRVVNFELAGDEKSAWQGFDGYFQQAASISPSFTKDDFNEAVSAQSVKKEILDSMSQNRFFGQSI
jgi:hypothetical protein